MRMNVKIAGFFFVVCACLCGAQMMPSAAKANKAEAVPTIDKNVLVYHPTRNNAELAELDEQKPQAKADQSLDAQIPSDLKPASRNEDVAEKVENGGCAVGTAAQLMDVFASGGIPIFLSKPTCWQN